MRETARYKAYSLNNFRDIPQMARLPESIKFDIEVVGHVLPFKANNFVVDHLINWAQAPADPLFVLTFPQRDMLLPQHYEEMAALLKSGTDNAPSRANRSTACSTSTAKPCCFSPARGRPATPIAASVSAGRSSSVCPTSSSPAVKWIA